MRGKSIFDKIVKAAAMTPADRRKATALLVTRLQAERAVEQAGKRDMERDAGIR